MSRLQRFDGRGLDPRPRKPSDADVGSGSRGKEVVHRNQNPWEGAPAGRHLSLSQMRVPQDVCPAGLTNARSEVTRGLRGAASTSKTRCTRIIDLASKPVSNRHRGQRSPARRATFPQPVERQAAMWLAFAQEYRKTGPAALHGASEKRERQHIKPLSSKELGTVAVAAVPVAWTENRRRRRGATSTTPRSAVLPTVGRCYRAMVSLLGVPKSA